MRRLFQRRRGASTVEMGLLLGLIAVALIGVIALSGTRTADILCRAGNGIQSGTPGSGCSGAPTEATAPQAPTEPTIPTEPVAGAAVQLATDPALRNALKAAVVAYHVAQEAPDNGVGYYSNTSDAAACYKYGVSNTGIVPLTGLSFDNLLTLCDAPVDNPVPSFAAFNSLTPCTATIAPGITCAIGLKLVDDAPIGYRVTGSTLATAQGATDLVLVESSVSHAATLSRPTDIVLLAGDPVPGTASFTVTPFEGLTGDAFGWTPSDYGICCASATVSNDGGGNFTLHLPAGYNVGTAQVTLWLDGFSSGFSGTSPPFTVTVEPGRILSAGGFQSGAVPSTEARRSAVGISAGTGGDFSGCALLPGGVPSCWGNSPEPPAELSSGVTALAVGSGTACGIRGGGVTCWGSGTGDGWGMSGNYTAPPSVASGATAIAAGRSSFCAVANGAAHCWMPGASELTVPPEAGSGVEAIASGSFYHCALKGGHPLCWQNDGTLWAVPDISGASSIDVTFGTGEDSACVTVGSALQCWSWGQDRTDPAGLIVTGSSAAQSSSLPVFNPPADLGAVDSVSIGGAEVCARTAAGGARCWGIWPISVPSGVVAVSAGQSNGLVLTR